MTKPRKNLKTKSPWMPIDKGGALSLMGQAKQVFLAGEYVDRPGTPPTILVSLPVHVANYLITAFDAVKEGKDANSAFALKNKPGRPPKESQNALVALESERLEAEGVPWTEKLALLMEQFNLSREGVISAAKAGKEAAEYHRLVFETFGEGCASDLLDHWKNKEKKV